MKGRIEEADLDAFAQVVVELENGECSPVAGLNQKGEAEAESRPYYRQYLTFPRIQNLYEDMQEYEGGHVRSQSCTKSHGTSSGPH